MSEGVSYRFRCQGSYSGEELRVARFTGTEGVSQLYRFEIELSSADPDIEPEDVLDQPWTLEMNVGGDSRVVHGIAGDFEELGQAGPDALYRATLVPRLWRVTHNPTSGAYLDQTVEETIRDLLEDEAGLTGEDYEIDLQVDYRKWEYRCQFGESPFHFLARIMERDGIYFFFDHDPEEKHEKLIVTDHRGRHPKSPEDSLTFAPDRGQEVEGFGRVLRSLVARTHQVPGKVVVKDHNPDQPSLDVSAEGGVDGGGREAVFEYGESVLDPDEAGRLSRVRTEELQCRRRRFFGEGSAVGLRPGARFRMEGHFRERFNRELLVTDLEHRGYEPSLLAAEEEGSADPSYECSLTALPGDVQFRPARTHDKPRFHGVMSAVVESEEETAKYAFVDDQGRYRVRLPFDLKSDDKPKGKASHWVRTATPYGGPEEGMHFRLREGVEVLLTFLEGDPDRPVISGVATNREQTANQQETDRTKHWLQTPGEVAIRFNDDEEEQGMDVLLWSSYQFQVGMSGLFGSKVNTEPYDPQGDTKAISRPPNTDAFVPRTHAGNLHEDDSGQPKTQPWVPIGYSDSPASYTRKFQFSGLGEIDVDFTRYRLIRRNADQYNYLVGDTFTWGDKENLNRDFVFGRSYTVTVADEGSYKGNDSTSYLIDTLDGQAVDSPVSFSDSSNRIPWADVRKNANVNLGSYDSINYVEGNIYDFGGYWEYAMGNGYEEALLDTKSDGSWPLNEDWVGGSVGKIKRSSAPGKQMPTFQSTQGPTNDVTGRFIKLDAGKTLISKTVDPGATGKGEGSGTAVGGVFDFTQADVIEVHRGASEEHRQGHSHELAYDGEGTLRSQAWKHGTDYEEQKWDPNGVPFYFKKGYTSGGINDWFEWNNMASMSLNMSLSSMNSTNIFAANSNELNVFASASSEINIKASAEFGFNVNIGVSLDLTVNVAAELEIKSAPISVSINTTAQKIEADGPGVVLDALPSFGVVYLKVPGITVGIDKDGTSIKMPGMKLELPYGMDLKV
ncbi:MAG TPA: type VI secretion system tip protein TssI/VgrG [Gammaproteobacteria bacterium]|nr:type VI secretion system tip protein TssI/VgrG [Gammaproteobacteria bacterium]